MVSTQSVTGTPAVYDSGQTAPGSATSTFAPETPTSPAGTLPADGRCSVLPVLDCDKRDDALRLYGSSSTRLQASPRESAMNGIVHRLRIICATTQPLDWKPVPGLAATLGALAEYAGSATATEKEAIGARLDSILKATTPHREKDVALLKTVIDRTMRGKDPMMVLGGLAEDRLKLPEFKIRVDGQEEPPARHFNSTLLPFASASYDYGPLGRTLMLEGARERFAGPSQEQRGEKLREAMFALANPPESGEPLETMGDIWSELNKLGIDV